MFLTIPAASSFDISAAITTMWAALGIIWLVGMAFQRPTIRTAQQSPGAWFFQTAIAALAFILVVTRWFQTGWLAARFVPQNIWVEYAAFALALAGCLFAIWARVMLAGNWNARPTLQRNHALVTEGPYALTRHPIYTGFVFAFAGTALAIGEYRALIALALIFTRLWMKVALEEKLMLQAFPADYSNYRKRVKALIPGLL